MRGADGGVAVLEVEQVQGVPGADAGAWSSKVVGNSGRAISARFADEPLAEVHQPRAGETSLA